jgi:hypothetical protein
MLSGSLSTCRTAKFVIRATIFSGAACGRHLWSFFLKPVFREDAFDAACADHPSGLSQLLRDHLSGSIAIEKAVPNDLSDHLGRSPIVRFGTAFPTSQSPCAVFAIEGAKLKVALLAVTELARRPERSTFPAFPFNEHQQLLRNLIVFADVQDPTRPNQRVVLRIELRHFCFLPKCSHLLGPAAQAFGRPC